MNRNQGIIAASIVFARRNDASHDSIEFRRCRRAGQKGGAFCGRGDTKGFRRSK